MEVDLDELDQEDSPYIMVDKLKAKFDKVWNKLCEVKGRSSRDIGRPIEQRFKYKGKNHIILMLVKRSS